MGRRSRTKKERREREKMISEKTENDLVSFHLYGSIFVLVVQVLFGIFILTSPIGSVDYYRTLNGIFISDLIIFISFVFNKNIINRIKLTLINIFKNNIVWSDKNSWFDILIFISIVYAVVTFIFLDYSFLGNYGLTIPTVVIVMLFRNILRYLKGG